MTRLRLVAAAALVVALAAPARAQETRWPNDQSGQNLYTAKKLRAPTVGNEAARLQDIAPGAGYLKAPGASTLPLTASSTVPLADIAPSSAAERFLCRGSAAGGGVWQECTIGTGLAISGTELSNTGGAGGAGGGVTNVSATLPLTSSGGTTPDIVLQYDNVSLVLDGGDALVREALTGAITAGQGSNATVFGVLAATSVLANATGSSAVPAALAATTNGQALRMAGGVLGWGEIATAGLANNAVTNAKFRQGAGLSLVGVAGNSTADVADIAAGSDGCVYRRSGTVVGCGTIGPLSAPALDATFITQTANANLANEQALGALASGVLQSVTSTGVASTFAVGANRIPRGSGSNGHLTDSAGLTYDGTTLLSSSSTTSTDVLHATTAITNHLNPTAIVESSAATGQAVLHFRANGGLRGGIRADYQGNLNWFAQGGDHVFFTDGDFSVGAARFQIRDAIGSTGERVAIMAGGLKVGDGTVAAPVVAIPFASYAATFQAWMDATPTRAVAYGNGLPGGAPSADAVIATYTGSAWVDRLHITNAGVVSIPNLTTGLVKATSGALSIAVAGTDYAAAGSYITSLTTDVVATGPGAAAATIQPGVVTLAKIVNFATDRFPCRDTAGTGSLEVCSAGGGLEWTGAPGLQVGAFTGDATKTAGGTALTLATVNSNVGSFTNASITVNGKGLITAASSGATPAPVGATYITQTADGTLTNEQALGALASGVLHSVTTTGVASTFAVGSARIPFGSGSNGALTDKAELKTNGQTFGLTGIQEVQIYTTSASTSALTGFRMGTDASFTNGFAFSMMGTGWSGGGLVANQALIEHNGGNTPMAFSNFNGGAAADITFATGGSRTVRLSIDGATGVVSVANLTSSRLVFAGAAGALSGSSALRWHDDDADLTFELAVTGHLQASTLAGTGARVVTANAGGYLTATAGDFDATLAYDVEAADIYAADATEVPVGHTTADPGVLGHRYTIGTAKGRCEFGLNILANSFTGGGSWTLKVQRNGSDTGISLGPYSSGTTTVASTSGTFSGSAGDVYSLVWNKSGTVNTSGSDFRFTGTVICTR